MNAELEKWLQDHAEWSDYLDSMPVATVEDLRALFAGKVLVPVELLERILQENYLCPDESEACIELVAIIDKEPT
jgi:hypothetical protein